MLDLNNYESSDANYLGFLHLSCFLSTKGMLTLFYLDIFWGRVHPSHGTNAPRSASHRRIARARLHNSTGSVHASVVGQSSSLVGSEDNVTSRKENCLSSHITTSAHFPQDSPPVVTQRSPQLRKTRTSSKLSRLRLSKRSSRYSYTPPANIASEPEPDNPCEYLETVDEIQSKRPTHSYHQHLIPGDHLQEDIFFGADLYKVKRTSTKKSVSKPPSSICFIIKLEIRWFMEFTAFGLNYRREYQC